VFRGRALLLNIDPDVSPADPAVEPAHKRILMIQTRFIAYGGAHLVTAWMMQALASDYDLTLLTWEEIDVARINRYYGTSLDSSQLEICTMSPLFRCLAKLDPDPQSVQPNLLVLRTAKKMRAQFDLLITAEMESDLGGAGVQYIHHPWFAHVFPHVISSILHRWAKAAAVIRGRVRPWMLLGDYSFDRMRTNLTVTNSEWTAQWLRQLYGLEATTLYPPAPGDFPQVPWEQRQNGVLCIGRLNPEKRADWVIEQLSLLRSKVTGLRLHIVGNQCYSKIERRYYRRLVSLVSANKDWVTLHENISRSELTELASRQRYGIHARQDEHFGIAVAEMVRAGCIPLVHNSGGQVEIVGREPRLTFDDPQIAARLLHIVNSPLEQEELRSMLARQACLFTPERFMEEIRRIVHRVLGGAEH